MKKYYVKENELMKETILSKGKGKPSKRLTELLIIIAERTSTKLLFPDEIDINSDLLQSGLLGLFENWKGVNHMKYDLLLPYYTEIFKRGATGCLNKLYYHQKNQQHQKMKPVYLSDYIDNPTY